MDEATRQARRRAFLAGLVTRLAGAAPDPGGDRGPALGRAAPAGGSGRPRPGDGRGTPAVGALHPARGRSAGPRLAGQGWARFHQHDRSGAPLAGGIGASGEGTSGERRPAHRRLHRARRRQPLLPRAAAAPHRRDDGRLGAGLGAEPGAGTGGSLAARGETRPAGSLGPRPAHAHRGAPSPPGRCRL